ncbi:hypothetical protein BS47DRAFT_629577 [Hydnum rufescens UP504]|uniref:Uncharacterized protein n=1 Tax=Hydnum rufescens UP504 TaxID=1448309 RepID=A0A9P6AGW6_9AGAM|nr:hypothetical protein BS47DRAFT_629577 [Hydnum rufescens UP504]
MAIVSADFSRENHQMHDPLVVGSYGSSHGDAPEYLSHDHQTPTEPTYALENWQSYAPHQEGNYVIGDHLQPQQTLHPTDPQVVPYHSSYDQHQHHPHSLQNDYTVDFHMHDVKSNHNPDFSGLASSYPPIKNGFTPVLPRSVVPTYSTVSSAASTPDPAPPPSTTTNNDFSPYLAVPQPQPARSLELGRMSIAGEFFEWNGAAASSPETIGESTHDSIHDEDLSQPISPYATPMAPQQQAPPLSTASSDHTGPQSPLDPHFPSDLSHHLAHSQPHHQEGMNPNSMASFTPLDFDFPRPSIVGLGSNFGFGSFGGSGAGLD